MSDVCWIEFETKVHTNVRKHGEGLLLVESGYYHLHISHYAKRMLTLFSVITNIRVDIRFKL